MILRTATPRDYDALGVVMYRAIHEGSSPYTGAQRIAWMPRANAGPDWAARLDKQNVVVTQDGTAIQGFMTVDAAGYIDLAYILPKARGVGRFSQLLNAIEAHASQAGIARLSTHASLMAQPAFARHGFAVLHHETVERAGQHLRRTAMSKPLT